MAQPKTYRERKHRWNALTKAQLFAEMVLLDERNTELHAENQRLKQEALLSESRKVFSETMEIVTGIQSEAGHE